MVPSVSSFPASPAFSFVPRSEFIRAENIPHHFCLLAFNGSDTLRMTNFPAETVKLIQTNLKDDIRHTVQDHEMGITEFTLADSPFAGKTIWSEQLILKVFKTVLGEGFRLLNSIDYGRIYMDRLYFAFSRPERHPGSLPLPTPKAVFAISFVSLTRLRVLSPPVDSTPAILNAIRSSWARGIESEKRNEEGCYSFRFKGYSLFAKDTSKQDTLHHILTLLKALDDFSFTLLTTVRATSRRSRTKDLWIMTSPVPAEPGSIPHPLSSMMSNASQASIANPQSAVSPTLVGHGDNPSMEDKRQLAEGGKYGATQLLIPNDRRHTRTSAAPSPAPSIAQYSSKSSAHHRSVSEPIANGGRQSSYSTSPNGYGPRHSVDGANGESSTARKKNSGPRHPALSQFSTRPPPSYSASYGTGSGPSDEGGKRASRPLPPPPPPPSNPSDKRSTAATSLLLPKGTFRNSALSASTVTGGRSTISDRSTGVPAFWAGARGPVGRYSKVRHPGSGGHRGTGYEDYREYDSEEERAGRGAMRPPAPIVVPREEHVDPRQWRTSERGSVFSSHTNAHEAAIRERRSRATRTYSGIPPPRAPSHADRERWEREMERNTAEEGSEWMDVATAEDDHGTYRAPSREHSRNVLTKSAEFRAMREEDRRKADLSRADSSASKASKSSVALRWLGVR
ncbi:hypothetical protein BOTBODRAFT_69247 [Botryobasidium botryosum FD-172 SS1]|uniref:Uncharacterized protein n=1 Tax=Botryobasidium botryosum (strain FD-172 SS1) TaxID=930990 RepID=A0A067M150_BOTB1|nr:hypothetical protein BOTBODRAFT_69247 [Botryobasidium botryosum FD-172 SS1]